MKKVLNKKSTKKTDSKKEEITKDEVITINSKNNGATTTKIKHILTSNSDLEHRFVYDYAQLKKLSDTFKEMGYRVVLTQGVYDLIHEGHASYLEAAKSQGDILIVGIHSDELTRKRKGPERPIVPETERLKMLVHLRHVDIVTLRHVEHEIGYLIRLIQPDVLVVSESTTDFTAKMASDYGDVCGKIVTLPPQATTTTSARIRNLTIEGAEKLAKELSNLTQDFLKKIRNK